MKRKKMDIGALLTKKQEGRKITMLTAYDYPTAKLLDEEGVDTLLIGDSVANVMLGYESTIPVTMDEMLHHVKAVTRAVKYAHVIGDMPFMSYNISTEQAIANCGRMLKEGGADSIKLEGGAQVSDTVAAIVRAGIPVVGHLGLTPQTAGMIGGYRMQGATAKAARKIIDDAKLLEDSGAFMIVLECIPDRVGQKIAETVRIPIIGIGAGGKCDGQVLVVNDMLGIKAGFSPKFVKQYADLDSVMRKAVQGYISEVATGEFPSPDHCFNISDEEFDKI
jgi:3-methyl-2-oxobutanoate hydroxymethyltransferase